MLQQYRRIIAEALHEQQHHASIVRRHTLAVHAAADLVLTSSLSQVSDHINFTNSDQKVVDVAAAKISRSHDDSPSQVDD